MATDTFKTLSEPSEQVLYKEKNSKFFAYAYPLKQESDVRQIVDALRKKHIGAGHFCYAWQLGVDSPLYRTNDDGEPANTAGAPIYGQIQSFGLTNVLIVVVRFFGGIKLGVGGLISAYRIAAQFALENAIIIEQHEKHVLRLAFEYKNLNKIMRIIKEKNIDIVEQKMEMDCIILVSIRKNESENITEIFESIFGVSVEKYG